MRRPRPSNLSSARWTPSDPVADSQRIREAGFENIWPDSCHLSSDLRSPSREAIIGERAEVGCLLPRRQRTWALGKSSPRSAPSWTRWMRSISTTSPSIFSMIYAASAPVSRRTPTEANPQRVPSDQNTADLTAEPLVTALRAHLIRAGGTSQAWLRSAHPTRAPVRSPQQDRVSRVT